MFNINCVLLLILNYLWGSYAFTTVGSPRIVSDFITSSHVNSIRFMEQLSDKLNAYTDSSPFIAAGTPFERPKICNSIVDAIGATPLVSKVYVEYVFPVIFILYRLN